MHNTSRQNGIKSDPVLGTHLPSAHTEENVFRVCMFACSLSVAYHTIFVVMKSQSRRNKANNVTFATLCYDLHLPSYFCKPSPFLFLVVQFCSIVCYIN